MQFILKSLGFLPSSRSTLLDRNMYLKSKVPFRLISDPTFLTHQTSFPLQGTYGECSPFLPSFTTHISVNIILFNSLQIHSFNEKIFIFLVYLRPYGKCLRLETDKTLYCPCSQNAHNLKRQRDLLTNNTGPGQVA